MDREVLRRLEKLNQLALTDAEKEEQQALRKEYIANVRANLRGQLNNIVIQKEDGSLENLGEKYAEKKKLS